MLHANFHNSWFYTGRFVFNPMYDGKWLGTVLKISLPLHLHANFRIADFIHTVLSSTPCMMMRTVPATWRAKQGRCNILKTKFTSVFWHSVTTVRPRRLVHYYIATYCIVMDKIFGHAVYGHNVHAMFAIQYKMLGTDL